MPVVVTGASGLVARSLIPLLIGAGSEVRGVVRRRESAEGVRDLGAKAAVCDLRDTATLEAVMDGAHTVIHLAGGLDVPDDAEEVTNLGTVRDALEAAAERSVPRFVLLSYPGADPESANPYLRAKGMAEEALRAADLQGAVVRATHVYGPESRWLQENLRAARTPLAAPVIGTGTQRLAPVFVEDVARALAGADDRDAPVTGTFGIQGPDVVTADELVDLLAGRRRRKIHLTPAAARRAGRLMGWSAGQATLEVLAADSLADEPDAGREFGISPTPLAQGLAASGVAVG